MCIHIRFYIRSIFWQRLKIYLVKKKGLVPESANTSAGNSFICVRFALRWLYSLLICRETFEYDKFRAWWRENIDIAPMLKWESIKIIGICCRQLPWGIVLVFVNFIFNQELITSDIKPLWEILNTNGNELYISAEKIVIMNMKYYFKIKHF